MTWFKVDDGFYDHPKTWDMSPGAIVVWLKCGCWSAHHLTDGYVPAGVARQFATDGVASIEELCDRGLWVQAPDGGYQFHDWIEWQPTRAQVLEQRKNEKERKARWRRSQRDKMRDNPVDTTPESQRDETADSTMSSGHPDPTRPDPPLTGGRGGSAGNHREPAPLGATDRPTPAGPDDRAETPKPKRPWERTVAEAIADSTPPPPEEDELP